MKVALLGDAQSIHTIRWANGLASRGIEVHLLTIHPVMHPLDSAVVVHRLPLKAPWGYLIGGFLIKRILKKVRPDILNVHFAGGYGLMGRMSGFRPLLLSIWGTDVYKLPHKTPLHYRIIRLNLASATAISSTSYCMAQAAGKIFTHSTVFITPFGVDEGMFRPLSLTRNPKGTIVIGTVKALRATYGIDTLLEAFALVAERALRNNIDVALEITGQGEDLHALRTRAHVLGIANKVTFHGAVPYAKVPEMLNRLDIYVALSRAESFGVAILEAGACGKPVVVSDAEGFLEVTTEKTGFVVPKENPQAAAEAIWQLVENAELRHSMGMAARAHVIEHYTWLKSVDTMLTAYKTTISQ
ncbi:glycosyltransferase family 4 protein [Pusillimonas caeni]|uniref:glycosyltransferase n=1 Tax=Pusillimonas caeni TaxID=1348472 RepID=UPI000E59BF31|nr:glycosyltransferase [Pusillimonas caeni]TFL14844.1 glycosyltransferase family 4 protein [Pusillimonas caeni]